MANLFPTSLFNLGPEFYGFLLPWIFTFAIIYGLLIKTNLFGDKVNRQVSVALAFVIAFFVTGIGGPQLAAFFTNLFGGASVFLAGILVLVIFTSLLANKKEESFLHKSWIPIAAVILIGIALFIASTGGEFLGGQIFIDS
ncbi:MAG: hypothetical protein QMD85_05230, partial [Candidatus Aenigmarchaeota archaeon]|nr:hypothetical protein [Candidatus Aenigmarchaeota archaeon]